MKIVSVFFIVAMVFALSACGQTGPLYLPGTKPPVYIPKTPKAKHTPTVKPVRKHPAASTKKG